MNLRSLYKLLFVLFLSFSLSNSYAQKNRQTRKAEIKKSSKKATKAQEESLLSMNDFLSSTARIMIIDSIVVDKDNMLKNIPFSETCGKMLREEELFGKTNKSDDTLTAYINGFSDRCIYSKRCANGKKKLAAANLIGGKWGKERILDELGEDFEDIGYPYIMPDGMTLYFSAVDKNNSFGGRDIYMTRLNTDSMRFYKAENIGLPYNSKANDYTCVIDDLNKLGWLATDRNQPMGKVCIYTFVPSDERWADTDASLDENKLSALATITNIKATQYDKTELTRATKRLEDIKLKANGIGFEKKNAAQQEEIRFIVNDSTIYKSITDFKSPTGRNMFISMLKLKKQQEYNCQQIETLRKSALQTSSQKELRAVKAEISKLEKTIETNETEIKNIEKKIRNAENLL